MRLAVGSLLVVELVQIMALLALALESNVVLMLFHMSTTLALFQKEHLYAILAIILLV